MSSIAQIKDSAYDGLKSLTVYGNTVQNLWVNPSGTMGGVTVTANENGTVSFSGDFDGTTVNVASDYIYALKPSTQYVLSIDKSVVNDDGGYFALQQFDTDGMLIGGSSKHVGHGNTLSTKFTTDASMAKCRYVFYANTNAVITNGTYRVMLNEGSTAQPWCPPGLSSIDNVEVVTAGKNLAGIVAPSLSSAITMPVKAGQRLVASLTTDQPITDSNNRIIYIHDGVTGEYLNAMMRFSATDTGRLQSSVWTCQESNMYKFVMYKGANRVTDLQLELGSTATAYEPPNITTTPIDLQGHTLNALPDGTRDELHIDGGGNVVLEKRTQTVQLDGDGSWFRFETPFVGYNSPWSNFNGLPSGFTFENLYVDKLPVSSSVPNGLYSANIDGTHAYLRDPVFATDAAGVKTWMGTNTPIAILLLLEPQTIDLGTIDLPKLRKKPLVNTIWANGTAKGTGFSLAPEIDCEYNRWSTYCDGFKTHGKHSYFDMGCCIAARDTGTPEKKSVTATVPYMSGFYDLSKLYGAIAFEARQLMYRFEFVEDSREELQQKKSQFLEWLSQVHDEEIADDDIPGRHFIGSLSEWEFEEGEEGQSGSLEVTFNCQPFLEADEDTTKTCNAGSNTVTVEGQPVNVYAKTSSGTATIQIGGVTQSVGTSEIRLSVQLQPGDNAVTVTGSPVVLRWKELTA